MIKKTGSIILFIALVFLNFPQGAKAVFNPTSNSLKATPQSDTSLSLDWLAGYDGNIFFIYRKDEADVAVLAACQDAEPLPGTVNANRKCQLALDGLRPGATYQYKFQEGASIERNYSASFTMPLKSNAIDVLDVTDVSARLSWVSDKEQDSRVVYYPKADEAARKEISEGDFVKTHSLLLTDLVPDTAYVFKVTSLDQAGGGMITDNLEFMTLPKSKSKIDLAISGVDFVTSENKALDKDHILVDFVISYKLVSSLPEFTVESPFMISAKSGQTADYPAPDAWSASSVIDGGKTLVSGQVYTERIGAYLLKKGTMLNADFSFVIDSNNDVEEFDEENNRFEKKIAVDGTPAALKIAEQVKCVFSGSKAEQKCFLAGDSELFSCSGISSCVMEVKKAKNEEVTWESSCGGYNRTYMDGVNESVEYGCDVQSISINESSRLLFGGQIDTRLGELKLERNNALEQRNRKRYISSLKQGIWSLSAEAESALNDFITYGVDSNTKLLGEGERAAVVFSYKAAFGSLPETEEELTDIIRIANGRFPKNTDVEAEKKAKARFMRIFSRVADMEDSKDAAAIKIMAYGLRQKAENRNLKSEGAGINTFKHIFGQTPKTTEDWNMMQAITYSGAGRKADRDKDGLADMTEAKFGTNPDVADTDKDGLKDGSEVLYGLNPLKR